MLNQCLYNRTECAKKLIWHHNLKKTAVRYCAVYTVGMSALIIGLLRYLFLQ